MILALAGLHDSGKSHLAQNIAEAFDWKVCLKHGLLKELHNRSGDRDDWVIWYRNLYKTMGPREVTRRVIELFSEGDHIVLDSVHNMVEWQTILQYRPDAVLALVVAPRAIRTARNGVEDRDLDIRRIGFWHEEDGGCLASESEWCFNGAADKATQLSEFRAFLVHHSVR